MYPNVQMFWIPVRRLALKGHSTELDGSIMEGSIGRSNRLASWETQDPATDTTGLKVKISLPLLQQFWPSIFGVTPFRSLLFASHTS